MNSSMTKIVARWSDYLLYEIPRPTGVSRAGIWPLKIKL